MSNQWVYSWRGLIYSLACVCPFPHFSLSNFATFHKQIYTYLTMRIFPIMVHINFSLHNIHFSKLALCKKPLHLFPTAQKKLSWWQHQNTCRVIQKHYSGSWGHLGNSESYIRMWQETWVELFTGVQWWNSLSLEIQSALFLSRETSNPLDVFS